MDRLSRRRLLTTLSAGALAGCIGRDSGERDATSTPDDTMSPGSASTPTQVSDSLPVSFGVEVLASFTDSGPARLRFALSNDTDDTLVVRTNASAAQGGPFPPVWGHHPGDARLGLFRQDGWAVKCGGGDGTSPVPESPVDGCWRPPCESVGLPSFHDQFELPSEGAKADVYVLLDGFNGECLPAGSYTFGPGPGDVSSSVARGTIREGEAELQSDPVAFSRQATVTVDADRTVAASANATVRD
jgi:hypothetical protein